MLSETQTHGYADALWIDTQIYRHTDTFTQAHGPIDTHRHKDIETDRRIERKTEKTLQVSFAEYCLFYMALL